MEEKEYVMEEKEYVMEEKEYVMEEKECRCNEPALYRLTKEEVRSCDRFSLGFVGIVCAIFFILHGLAVGF